MKTTGLLSGNDPKVAPVTSDLTVQGGAHSVERDKYRRQLHAEFACAHQRLGHRPDAYLNDKGNTYGKTRCPTSSTTRRRRTAVWSFRLSSRAPRVHERGKHIHGSHDLLTRHNVYLDGTFFGNLAGQNHTLKVGYALNRIANDVLSNYTQGRFNIYWGKASRAAPSSTARAVRLLHLGGRRPPQFGGQQPQSGLLRAGRVADHPA